jgi:hypothetical protein
MDINYFNLAIGGVIGSYLYHFLFKNPHEYEKAFEHSFFFCIGIFAVAFANYLYK